LFSNSKEMNIFEIGGTYGEILKLFNSNKILFNLKHINICGNTIGLCYQPTKNRKTSVYTGLYYFITLGMLVI
jgi:hypothetical protein